MLTSFRSSQKSFGVEDAIKELKKCKIDDESNHVRSLLKQTYGFRRNFIETEAKGIGHILGEVPLL